MQSPYYGETQCQATTKSTHNRCTNLAYWEQNSVYLCGVHSRGNTRTALQKNPNKSLNSELLIKAHEKSIEDAATLNQTNGLKGKVVCYKMKMMRTPGLDKGYLNIFPNYLHGNRKDGLGLPSLSPKSIGPIKHPQPGLPDASNLENFHQGNKVFEDEVDINGEPTPYFFKTQLEMYTDPIPHRHKASAHKVKGNKNIPLYSIWVLPDNTKQKIDYFTSRQFYCNYYESLIKDNLDYKLLVQKIKDGYNLRICGYDAYDVKQSVEDCYKDTSKPFGHELVLYTMLVEDISNYPWRKYKTFAF